MATRGNPKLTIRLTPDELAKLATLAGTKGTTMAELVRAEVRKLLNNEK